MIPILHTNIKTSASFMDDDQLSLTMSHVYDIMNLALSTNHKLKQFIKPHSVKTVNPTILRKTMVDWIMDGHLNGEPSDSAALIKYEWLCTYMAELNKEYLHRFDGSAIVYQHAYDYGLLRITNSSYDIDVLELELPLPRVPHSLIQMVYAHKDDIIYIHRQVQKHLAQNGKKLTWTYASVPPYLDGVIPTLGLPSALGEFSKRMDKNFALFVNRAHAEAGIPYRHEMGLSYQPADSILRRA
jgi:hypothetical protein